MTVLSSSGVIAALSSSNRVDTVTRARPVCPFPTCRSRIKTFSSIKSLCNHIFNTVVINYGLVTNYRYKYGCYVTVFVLTEKPFKITWRMITVRREVNVIEKYVSLVGYYLLLIFLKYARI